jgi:hypothetical protein
MEAAGEYLSTIEIRHTQTEYAPFAYNCRILYNATDTLFSRVQTTSLMYVLFGLAKMKVK